MSDNSSASNTCTSSPSPIASHDAPLPSTPPSTLSPTPKSDSERGAQPTTSQTNPTFSKVTLKDGDATRNDTVIQMTTTHPPPPPPPAPGVLAGLSNINNVTPKPVVPPPDNIQPAPSSDDSQPPQPSPLPAPSLPHALSTNENNGLSLVTTSPTTAAAPSHPTRSSAPAERLAEKLENARIAATANPYYLALGHSVRIRTAWIRDGRANVLVAKDAAQTLAQGLAAHAADPTVTPAPVVPPRVPCSIIGTVSMDQCYLRADGNFKGINPALPWQKTFTQTALSFVLGCPPPAYPSLVKDFHTAIATFDAMLPKNVNIKSGHYAQGLPAKHLRLRHIVFAIPEPIQPRSNTTEPPAGTPDTALPADFTIYQWPTYSTEAADALAAIVDSHVARPLPAYDIRGDLISPAQYGAALRGATVLLYFNIVHYSISEKRTNGTETTKQQICLDVDYIRVLIPPPHTSAVKRKAVHLTDPHSHAAKKLRQL